MLFVQESCHTQPFTLFQRECCHLEKPLKWILRSFQNRNLFADLRNWIDLSERDEDLGQELIYGPNPLKPLLCVGFFYLYKNITSFSLFIYPTLTK